ncbi:hypothetical protein NDI85_19725 [Halomicroarcula sp. S1AR25-4]|uniref:hypothetical protein n=1 Tax=Haloarcula sp. S1AR25-4 TaxID=2950538 RepID=UPI0028747156|nr:hypothetical protein [Halomicroarcula sp. S1AR25-4]MDS0280018.1 hypothetical protein [Halomicroarcula sp. S1AR25-4]
MSVQPDTASLGHFGIDLPEPESDREFETTDEADALDQETLDWFGVAVPTPGETSSAHARRMPSPVGVQQTLTETLGKRPCPHCGSWRGLNYWPQHVGRCDEAPESSGRGFVPGGAD